MKKMTIPVMQHRDIYMKSDKYLNDSEHVKEMEDMGCDVVPVDLNNAFVPVDKNNPENLSETEENIGDRFSLGGD